LLSERKASDRRELLEDDRLYGGLSGPGGIGGYGGLSPEFLPDVAVDEKREKNGSDRKPGQDRTSKPWFSVHQGGNRGGLMMVPNLRRRVEEPKSACLSLLESKRKAKSPPSLESTDLVKNV